MERISEGFDRIFRQFWERILKFHFGSTVFWCNFPKDEDMTEKVMELGSQQTRTWLPHGLGVRMSRRVLKTNRDKQCFEPTMPQLGCSKDLTPSNLTKQLTVYHELAACTSTRNQDLELLESVHSTPAFNTVIKEEMNPILDKLTCHRYEDHEDPHNMNVHIASDWFEAVWNVTSVWLYHMTPRLQDTGTLR